MSNRRRAQFPVSSRKDLAGVGFAVASDGCVIVRVQAAEGKYLEAAVTGENFIKYAETVIADVRVRTCEHDGAVSHQIEQMK